MKTAALSLVALTCSCVDAFTVSTTALRPQANARATVAASSTPLRMGLLKEGDFIPSEEWLGEYMGQQGLRYALNKTPEEVKKEGDYTLLEKLFGQTSNNKARMDLKAEVLAKANIPTNPSLYKSWTAKYGYGRFFPVYVDKSGNPDGAPAEPVAKAVSHSKPAAAPAAKKGPVAAAKKGPVAAAKKGPVVAAKKAAPAKVAAKPAPKKQAPKKVAPQGNISNLPKAL
eukprot:jgi/Undpi1/2602/HiC_scaffold_13.g05981.m1